MSLILLNARRPQYSCHTFHNLMDQFLGDLADFTEQKPERSKGNKLDDAKDSQIINDEHKFAVSLNVSNFKPDELKVNLEDRILTIEGIQEEQTEQGYCKRSFVRKWQLPEDVDADEIEPIITETGFLQIEAKKKSEPKTRNIPIMSKQ